MRPLVKFLPVPESENRLHDIGFNAADTTSLAAAFRRDQVVLVRNVADQMAADGLISSVAKLLGLFDRLKMQAEFASIHGHRESVGQYCMTVNRRESYQFIPPHSEGTANVGIQIGSLYCRQNTTDGGANILFNCNDNSAAWSKLHESCVKVDLRGRVIGRKEEAMLRALHGITLPGSNLSSGLEVIRELSSPVAGVRLCEVLQPTQMARSQILGRDVHVLWDNVATIDFDLAADFMRTLQYDGLLKYPAIGPDITCLDVDYRSHIWHSGLTLAECFQTRVTHRLAEGEMLIFNNLTWAHSTANWTPGSGTRDVVAAFA